MTGGSDALFGSPRQPKRRRGLECSCSVLRDVDTVVMVGGGVCVGKGRKGDCCTRRARVDVA